MAHTTACLGLRPVAKALGCSLGEMATLGMGNPARSGQVADEAEELGRVGSVDDRGVGRAQGQHPLNQYEPPTVTRASTKPMSSAVVLPPPSSPATRTMRPPRPPSSAVVLRVLANMRRLLPAGRYGASRPACANATSAGSSANPRRLLFACTGQATTWGSTMRVFSFHLMPYPALPDDYDGPGLGDGAPTSSSTPRSATRSTTATSTSWSTPTSWASTASASTSTTRTPTGSCRRPT